MKCSKCGKVIDYCDYCGEELIVSDEIMCYDDTHYCRQCVLDDLGVVIK